MPKYSSLKLTATSILPSTAVNKTITWEVNNPSYASIDSTGKITINGKAKLSVAVTGTVNIQSSGAMTVTSSGTLDMSSTGAMKVKSSGALDIESTGAASIKGNLTIKGGSLTATGTASPSGSGPFCGLPACLFTGAPHVGSIVSGN